METCKKKFSIKRFLTAMMTVAMILGGLPTEFVQVVHADGAKKLTKENWALFWSNAEGFPADGNYILTFDLTGEDKVTTTYAVADGFAGTFDADGHTIELDINSSVANTGLFGKLITGAKIKKTPRTAPILTK